MFDNHEISCKVSNFENFENFNSLMNNAVLCSRCLITKAPLPILYDVTLTIMLSEQKLEHVVIF